MKSRNKCGVFYLTTIISTISVFYFEFGSAGCIYDTNTIYCREESGRFLKHPKDTNVLSMILIRSDLRSMIPEDFTPFERVHDIHISACVFPDTGQRGLFTALKNIKSLVIKSSNCPEDLGLMFSDNTTVKNFVMNMNNLNWINGDLSLHFPVVQKIDLRQNEILKIGSLSSNGVFSNLQYVSSIILRTNSIEQIYNFTFANISNIENIDLSYNQINKIDRVAFNISGKSEVLNSSRRSVCLNLSNNALRQIENQTFCLCSEVTMMNLANNRIIRLHSEAFEGLSSLRELVLRNNRINKIVSGVFHPLISLETLDMTQNAMTEILPDLLNNCRNLSKLVLSSNKITHVHPNAFESLTSLSELLLVNNSLTFVGNAFETLLPLLVVLDVRQNVISRIEAKAFKGCLSLRTLDLSENTVSHIENYAFASNFRLLDLRLRDNHLEQLSCASFSNLSSLNTLDLSGNTLNAFRLRDFIHLKNLNSLRLNLSAESVCDCSVFARMEHQRVQLTLGSRTSTDQCNSYYKHYLSGDEYLARECTVPVAPIECDGMAGTRPRTDKPVSPQDEDEEGEGGEEEIERNEEGGKTVEEEPDDLVGVEKESRDEDSEEEEEEEEGEERGEGEGRGQGGGGGGVEHEAHAIIAFSQTLTRDLSPLEVALSVACVMLVSGICVVVAYLMRKRLRTLDHIYAEIDYSKVTPHEYSRLSSEFVSMKVLRTEQRFAKCEDGEGFTVVAPTLPRRPDGLQDADECNEPQGDSIYIQPRQPS